MESFFQKYRWIINLLLIALGAVLVAAAVNRFIAIQLAPYTVPELPTFSQKSEKKSKKPRQSKRSYVRTIVDRCLFGCPDEPVPVSECPDGCEEGEVCQQGQCVPGNQEATVSSEIPIESELSVKLLGAMVAADPEYSMALINDPSQKTTYIIGVGEEVMGAEIVEIRRDRVIVRRNGRLEYIRLENTLLGKPSLPAVKNTPRYRTGLETSLSVPPPTAGRPSSRAKSASEKTPDAANARKSPGKPVEKTGPNSFVLDGDAVEEALGDTQKLAQQAKILPNYKNGKPSGIKLVGVAGDSVYAQIGIESGDVVHSINGVKIRNQAHAFELLQGMRNKKSASIEIERRGQRKTFQYKVK